MPIENLTFTVDSALLGELGERLVETEYYALVELVKNSYDADAKEVYVQIGVDSDGIEEIIIEDDGLGMTFDEVKDYWMKIATTNKLREMRSPKYGRDRAGAKGIGRFACRRLGNSLQLITIGKVKEGSLQETKVLFEWDKFVPGEDITTIHCPGEINFKKEGKSGTKLILKDNRRKKDWGKRSLDYIRRNLAFYTVNRGTQRDGYEDDPGFQIILVTPENGEENIQDLRQLYINGGWGTLKAEINSKSQAVCILDALEIGEKKMISKETFPLLNDVKLEIGIFPQKKKQLRNPALYSKQDLNETLKDWGGVQVRYKGFRVFPYGDDDWLDLEKDRARSKLTLKDDDIQLHEFAISLDGLNPSRYLLTLLGMKNFIGQVNLGTQAKGFEIKANREGFLGSPEFEQLKQFVRFAIFWATIYRDYYFRLLIKKDADTAREIIEELTQKNVIPYKATDAALDYLNKEFDYISSFLSPEKKREIGRNLSQVTDAIRTLDSSKTKELNHLRLIASTSSLLLSFSHEVKFTLLNLVNQEEYLKELKTKIRNNHSFENQETEINKIDGYISELHESQLRFKELLSMTTLLSKNSSEDLPFSLNIKDHLGKAIRIFSLIINKYQININTEKIPATFNTHQLMPAEFYSIIFNVISNSIKSVIAGAHKDNRQIELLVEKRNERKAIYILDNGIGLDLINSDDLFIPFNSDPDKILYNKLSDNINQEDDFFVGSGTGIGLSLVKNIIEARGGSVKFVQPDNEWKSKLEIIIE